MSCIEKKNYDLHAMVLMILCTKYLLNKFKSNRNTRCCLNIIALINTIVQGLSLCQASSVIKFSGDQHLFTSNFLVCIGFVHVNLKVK